MKKKHNYNQLQVKRACKKMTENGFASLKVKSPDMGRVTPSMMVVTFRWRKECLVYTELPDARVGLRT